MHGIITTEGWHQGAIKALDRMVVHADGIPLLGSKRTCHVEHTLVIFNDARSYGLNVGASRCLPDVLKDSVGLVAVPRA